MRRQIASELVTLRAVAVPDLPAVISRIGALEDRAATLPVLGVPVATARRSPPVELPGGMIERALQRVAQAFHDLVSLRRVDPANVRLVTGEEESLRRQHLELLLFSARIAATQQDCAAFVQSLRSADSLLAQFFDAPPRAWPRLAPRSRSCRRSTSTRRIPRSATRCSRCSG